MKGGTKMNLNQTGMLDLQVVSLVAFLSMAPNIAVPIVMPKPRNREYITA